MPPAAMETSRPEPATESFRFCVPMRQTSQEDTARLHRDVEAAAATATAAIAAKIAATAIPSVPKASQPSQPRQTRPLWAFTPPSSARSSRASDVARMTSTPANPVTSTQTAVSTQATLVPISTQTAASTPATSAASIPPSEVQQMPSQADKAQMNITRSMINEHGPTMECRACRGLGRIHILECRERFETLCGAITTKLDFGATPDARKESKEVQGSVSPRQATRRSPASLQQQSIPSTHGGVSPATPDASPRRSLRQAAQTSTIGSQQPLQGAGYSQHLLSSSNVPSRSSNVSSYQSSQLPTAAPTKTSYQSPYAQRQPTAATSAQRQPISANVAQQRQTASSTTQRHLTSQPTPAGGSLTLPQRSVGAQVSSYQRQPRQLQLGSVTGTGRLVRK